MGKQKIEYRTVVGQLLTWQHHLIWALFVDLALPCAPFVQAHNSSPLTQMHCFLEVKPQNPIRRYWFETQNARQA
jgi:hypothetical protein